MKFIATRLKQTQYHWNDFLTILKFIYNYRCYKQFGFLYTSL